MEYNNTKEVYFDKYCDICRYKDYPEEAEPCCYCLNEPYNIDSHKPTRYKEIE